MLPSHKKNIFQSFVIFHSTDLIDLIDLMHALYPPIAPMFFLSFFSVLPLHQDVFCIPFHKHFT